MQQTREDRKTQDIFDSLKDECIRRTGCVRKGRVEQ